MNKITLKILCFINNIKSPFLWAYKESRKCDVSDAHSIELVIKVDENTYNNFVRNEYSRVDVIAIHNALVNGTPLTKGHGRLIDADALKKDDEVTEWLSLNSVRTSKMLKSFSELFIKKINDAPTIIGAESEK